MSLYNIEFFDRQMNCTHHAETDVDYIETDYLASENTTIKILKTDKVNVQDIVYVRELPDYVGIVSSVKQDEYTTSVQIKPFVTLFDKPILFNTANQKGEIELRMGFNRLYLGSPSSLDTNDQFYIFLKPEEYKFGLFNAAGEGGVAFKKISDIKFDEVQFVAKCGNSIFNTGTGQIYGPRVCANGAVNQPNVGSGTYLYYRIDNDGKTSYGNWDGSMIKGQTTQDGETMSGDDWLRKNVQLLCSPSYIFVTENAGSFQAYASSRNGFNSDKAFWSFFGKDRHGRFFLGRYSRAHGDPQLTPRGLWDALHTYCGITELAIVGGGVAENGSTSQFITMPASGMQGWSYTDMATINPDNPVGDTFAFYRTLGENEEVKKPTIRSNLTSVKIDPDMLLERYIAFIIESNWIARSAGGYTDDPLMTFPIGCISPIDKYRNPEATYDWNLGIKPDNQSGDGTIFPYSTVNFYSSVIQEAFKKYRIVVNAKINWESKKIIITFEKPSKVVHIDADLPNVKIKEFVDGKALTDTNKLTVLDSNGYDKRITFYRYNSSDGGEYKGVAVGFGTVDKDRIYPVVEDVLTVDTSTNEGENKKDFTALAWEQADGVFGSIQYRNYIELEIYDPPEIALGQICYIHHNGDTYETVLSGYKEGDMKTLIFGAHRADYTKSMIVKETKQTADVKKVMKTAWSSTR